MIKLEQRLAERFPDWFKGPKAILAQGLSRSLEKFGKIDEMNAWLSANAHRTGFDFVEGVLDYIGTRYTVDQVERGRIPQTGRVIIVANHPLGALDSLALLHLVGTVRRDVRILANDLLLEFEGLRELLLPLRILGGRPRAESLAAVTAALEAEQAVIVFPAGEVSRFGWGGVRDGRWRAGFIRFARKSGAPVLPVHIKAKNSVLFYGLSSIYKPIGTALLPREIFKARGLRIDLRIGVPRKIEGPTEPEGSGFDMEAALASVRQALEAIGTRRESAPPGPAPLIHAVDRGLLREAVRAATLIGRMPDGKEIRLTRLASDSLLLREIGRERERSFRAVGEGTGRSFDVAPHDTWYEHIVLWDDDALRIVGAYRVCRGSEVLSTRGLAGLYTSRLFEFGPEALAHAAEGLELGRSFVAPEYWGSRSLDYLWLGIGAYLRTHPEVRYLFGAVSISAALPIAAREHLVAYYGQHHGVPGLFDTAPAGAPPARARQPFRFMADAPCYQGLDAEQSFQLLKVNLDALGAKVPVLYKQYVDICEPGGARFLAFGVDPTFANCVDGLIVLDLQRIKPKKFQRYMAGAGVALASGPAPAGDPA